MLIGVALKTVASVPIDDVMNCVDAIAGSYTTTCGRCEEPEAPYHVNLYFVPTGSAECDNGKLSFPFCAPPFSIFHHKLEFNILSAVNTPPLLKNILSPPLDPVSGIVSPE